MQRLPFVSPNDNIIIRHLTVSCSREFGSERSRGDRSPTPGQAGGPDPVGETFVLQLVGPPPPSHTGPSRAPAPRRLTAGPAPGPVDLFIDPRAGPSTSRCATGRDESHPGASMSRTPIEPSPSGNVVFARYLAEDRPARMSLVRTLWTRILYWGTLYSEIERYNSLNSNGGVVPRSITAGPPPSPPVPARAAPATDRLRVAGAPRSRRTGARADSSVRTMSDERRTA